MVKYNVAGLDLSLRSAGVAIIKSSGEIISDAFGYALTKESSERDRLERVMSITSKIINFLKEHDVKYVGVENYAFSKAFGSAHSLTLQADLGGVVKTQIYVQLKTVPLVIPVTTIRKFILGKSTKEKNPVQRHFENKGIKLKTQDEYDALAVCEIVNFWCNNRGAADNDYLKSLLERLDFQVSKSIQI